MMEKQVSREKLHRKDEKDNNVKETKGWWWTTTPPVPAGKLQLSLEMWCSARSDYAIMTPIRATVYCTRRPK